MQHYHEENRKFLCQGLCHTFSKWGLEPYGMYWNKIIEDITTYFVSKPSDLHENADFCVNANLAVC